MNQRRALVIDDEPDIRELLEITLGRMRIATDSAANLAEAYQLLATTSYDLCLTDMRLPDGKGLELVQYIQQHLPKLPVAVITAHGSVDTAIESMKAGAFDFISKPVDLAVLRKLVSTAIDSSQLPPPILANHRIVGQSVPIHTLIKQIEKLARSQAPVYINGESGTGKELVARSIHELGPRAEKPFIAVNCGAIPKELMESEFFGHKRGSFTGAHQDKAGLFQVAEGGTLFFDEVADLPLDMQVKLLRVIQEKSIRPVGAEKEISIDVRLLCATHKSLDVEVKEGRFRQDLFYRLNVIQVDVPSLRDRPDDIPLLSEFLLTKLAKEMAIDKPLLTECAQKKLMGYHFTGNVRELENILERAITLCENSAISESDLLLKEHDKIEQSQPSSSSTDVTVVPEKIDYSTLCLQFSSLDEYLNHVESQILCKQLTKAKWNKTLAAKQLGISFRSLRYRLQKLGLDDE